MRPSESIPTSRAAKNRCSSAVSRASSSPSNRRRVSADPLPAAAAIRSSTASASASSTLGASAEVPGIAAWIVAQPSPSGDLNDYGGAFADFLAAYPHAVELPYLADVARLEWLVQAVYYAADAGPADLSALAATPPERCGELRFALAPRH